MLPGINSIKVRKYMCTHVSVITDEWFVVSRSDMMVMKKLTLLPPSCKRMMKPHPPTRGYNCGHCEHVVGELVEGAYMCLHRK